MSSLRIRRHEMDQLREDLAFGSHNFGLAVQNSSMAKTPVHGDFRSFAPGAKPIGGTLRRSHYTVTFVDGRMIAGPQGGVAVPDDLHPGPGIVTMVGTSAGYGLYVHEGTSKMPARPHLTEALMEQKGNAPALIAAGARGRHPL